MKVKFFKLLILPLIGLAFGIVQAIMTTPSANAAYFKVGQIHSTTPKAWRGNWYSYVNGHICVTHINKYSVTQTYRGNTHSLFRSNWTGYKKLAVAKVKHSTKYTFNALAQRAYQSDGGWKTASQTINHQRVEVLRDYNTSNGYVDLFRAPVYRTYAK